MAGNEFDPFREAKKDEVLMIAHEGEEKTSGAHATPHLRDEEAGFEQTGSSSGASSAQLTLETT
jgi:hypothetical protein